MTEVDYSPEAYARYMATKNRVSNWAADTSAYAAQYTHPFDSHQPRPHVPSYGYVPEVRPDDSISLYDGGAARRARSAERRSHQRGPSITQPPPPLPRARSHPSAQRPAPPPPPPPAPAYYAPAPAPYSPRASAPQAGQQTYRTIDLSKYTRQGEFILPPPPPGETYMIIPPKGKRIEVVGPNGQKTYSSSQPTSPTKRPSHRAHQSYSTSANTSRSGSPASAPAVYHQVPASVPAPGYTYGTPQLYAPVAQSSRRKAQQPLLKRLFVKD